MSKKQDEILDAISKLTVIELSELIKAMEEKFDVSASAAVAVAPAGAATHSGRSASLYLPYHGGSPEGDRGSESRSVRRRACRGGSQGRRPGAEN